MEILLTPLQMCDISATLPGPLLALATIISQRLFHNGYFSDPESAAEDNAFKVWSMSYELVFRKTFNVSFEEKKVGAHPPAASQS